MSCTVEVKIAHQHKMSNETHDESLQLVKTVEFPFPGHEDKPRAQLIKEHICELEIDPEFEGHPLCMQISFKDHGVSGWKYGWVFEAVSIEFK